VTTTLAGIAIALVALSPDSVTAPFLILAGLASLAGSAYAMAVMWDAIGLSRNDFLGRPQSSHAAALVYAGWGLVLLGLAYVARAVETYVL